jgi:hypothetical protein
MGGSEPVPAQIAVSSSALGGSQHPGPANRLARQQAGGLPQGAVGMPGLGGRLREQSTIGGESRASECAAWNSR